MSRPPAAWTADPRRAEAGRLPWCFPARTMVLPRLPLPAQTSFRAGTAPHAARGPWPADDEIASRRPPPACPSLWRASTAPSPGTPTPAASPAPGPFAAGTGADCAPAHAAAEPTLAPAAEPQGLWAAARKPPPVPATRAAPARSNASTRCPTLGPLARPSVPRPGLPGSPPPAVGPTSAPHGPGPNTAEVSCGCRGSGCEAAHRPSSADVSWCGHLAQRHRSGWRSLLLPRPRLRRSSSSGTSWRSLACLGPRVVRPRSARSARRFGQIR